MKTEGSGVGAQGLCNRSRETSTIDVEAMRLCTSVLSRFVKPGKRKDVYVGEFENRSTHMAMRIVRKRNRTDRDERQIPPNVYS